MKVEFFWISLIPAIFMTSVTLTYVCRPGRLSSSPEPLDMQSEIGECPGAASLFLIRGYRLKKRPTCRKLRALVAAVLISQFLTVVFSV